MVLNVLIKNENPNICGTGGYRVNGLFSQARYSRPTLLQTTPTLLFNLNKMTLVIGWRGIRYWTVSTQQTQNICITFYTMLDQRWADVVSILYKWFLFAGKVPLKLPFISLVNLQYH